MTTEQHPITPPPELVEQWWQATMPNIETSVKDQLCTQAARWGADQELEACLQLLYINGCPSEWLDMLRAARRRPKPPSLAEEALMQLQAMEQAGALDCNIDAIRAALERLKELEDTNG